MQMRGKALKRKLPLALRELRYPRKGMFAGEEMEIGFGAVLF